MSEVTKYLTNIGATPVVIIFIGIVIWTAQQYVTHKLQKERKKWEEELKFISERHIARNRLLEEINGLIHNFDHYVVHVFEGDGGWYKEAINEKYREIRKLTRDKIELVSDFSDFEEEIYNFTESGRVILDGKFDFNQYKESKLKVNGLISKVRETLPSVN